MGCLADLLQQVNGLTAPKIGFPETFALIADKILNETQLSANGKRYRINEIEFYLTGKAHPDPFTHQDKQQLTSCQWYFHKHGAKYRDGNYKGLDITFGTPFSISIAITLPF